VLVTPGHNAYGIKMKKFQMFRRLLWFPIISILLFNITFKIQDRNYHVPHVHYYILIALVAIFLATFFFKKGSK
jgi:cell division protein FtsW (lipid II flippase)